MKKYLVLFFSILAFSANAWCSNNDTERQAPVSIIWEMKGHEIEPGYYENTFYIINNSKESLRDNWAIYFGQKQVVPRNEDSLPLIVERIAPTHYRMYPSKQYKSIASGDTLVMAFRCRGNIIKSTAAPEGAYWVQHDTNGEELAPKDIHIKVIPYMQTAQWTRKNASELPYPDAQSVYDENEIFSTPIKLSKTDIFPSIESVKPLKGDFVFTQKVYLNYSAEFENEAQLLKEKLNTIYNCIITQSAQGSTVINLKKTSTQNLNKEYYELILNNNSVDIIGSNAHSIFNGTQSLLSILGKDKLPLKLSNTSISDYPDVHHRGLMVDVARNFTTKKNLLKLIDVLSMYKMSVLHLHLTDDEGWRIEIPDLEELTEVGARRGHTHNESDRLYPAYTGGWDALDLSSSANGYYTRADFIEILKYAKKRHINVIPEIDLPGHARAAIVAMNARYYKYINTSRAKAEEYLLAESADTSRYVSAQSYTDNVINVALPSAYHFVEKVVDEVQLMYKEAGVDLNVFHLGGDEVPRGSWTGSPLATAFMKEHGISETRGLKDYFVKRTLDILNKKDIQLGAWQEVALLPDRTANERFANDNVLSYCWSTIPEWHSDQIPYKLANSGYPVILCNISNFYFDLAYNKHQDEPGAYWAGFVNEHNSFDMLPYDIYRSVHKTLKGELIDLSKASENKEVLKDNARKEIKGIQGQLWAETVRNFDMIGYYLFPKMYGLIERAWNTQPNWANTLDDVVYKKALIEYNAKIEQREIPRLPQMGMNFRVPNPGIKLIEGKLYANSSVSGAEIRYTLDGSEPTTNSMLWKKPIHCNSTHIKAKVFYLGKKSVTTTYGFK